MNWLVLTHLFMKPRTRKSHKKRKTKTRRHHNMTRRRNFKGG
jgi:hypothetical protein